MAQPLIDVVREPKGKTYKALLNYALSQCVSFSLVWREQLKFEETASEFDRSLKSHLLRSVRCDTWPGTRLIGHYAVVRYYRVTEESIAALKIVDGLYSWLSPRLPEDLAFYRANQECWLETVSHEHWAYFRAVNLSLEELQHHVPGIKVRLLEC